MSEYDAEARSPVAVGTDSKSGACRTATVGIGNASAASYSHSDLPNGLLLCAATQCLRLDPAGRASMGLDWW